MGESFLEKKGGSSSSTTFTINDTVEEFKYVYRGRKIKTGDFVNYINGVAGVTSYGTSTDSQLSTSSSMSTVISAVELDDNRILVSYAAGGSSNYLYGIVCTIVDGVNITYGTETELYVTSTSHVGKYTSLVKLPSGKVFLAAGGDSGGLRGFVLTVNGTTITPSSPVIINSDSMAGIAPSATLVDNTRIFISHQYNSSRYYVYGTVVTVIGDTIIPGTTTSISTARYAGTKSSAVTLSGEKVFVAHSRVASYYLEATLCQVSGTTFKLLNSLVLNSTTSSTGYYISSCVLEDERILVSHGYNPNYYYLYGIVCKISDTNTILAGADTQLRTDRFTGKNVSSLLLSDGNVFIAHDHHYSDQKLGATICKVEDLIVSTVSTAILNNESNSANQYVNATYLRNGTIFIAHNLTVSGSHYPYAQIFGAFDGEPSNDVRSLEYEEQVIPVSESICDAIALSNGNGAIEYIEGDVKYTNNLFPTSGWTEVTAYTKYNTSDGWEVEASSTLSNNYSVYRISEGSTGNSWRPSSSSTTNWVQMKAPIGRKITKVKIMCYDAGQSYALSGQFQGSFNGTDWVDLCPFSAAKNQVDYQEFKFNNADYYIYYRLTLNGFSGTMNIYEWQVSEYTERGLVLNTEHNQQVKIARIYKEILKTGNIFPTSNWTQITAYTKYYTSSGYLLEASGVAGAEAESAKSACNDTYGSSSMPWYSNTLTTYAWIKMTCPKPTKITKMKTFVKASNTNYFLKAVVQGSKGNDSWVDLYTIPTYQTEFTEITLTNTDFYTDYRIEIYLTSGAGDLSAQVTEWQTSEYVEVIQ